MKTKLETRIQKHYVLLNAVSFLMLVFAVAALVFAFRNAYEYAWLFIGLTILAWAVGGFIQFRIINLKGQRYANPTQNH